MENPIKMDDLGVPLFLEATIISMQIAHKFEPWQISSKLRKKNTAGLHLIFIFPGRIYKHIQGSILVSERG